MRNIKLAVMLAALFTASAFANNEVYIEQIGSSSTITITQQGADNKVGTSTTPAFIGGGSTIVTIDQVGDANELQFVVNGASTNMALNVTGSTNVQIINCGTTTSASCSGSTINQTITGDSNQTTVNLGAGANHTSLMTITGSDNIVTHTSTSSGTTSADITIAGNTNTIGVTQSGTLTNTVVLSTTGNNNAVSITQSN